MRTFETPLGTFSNSMDYRKALKDAGYINLGWMNGWSNSDHDMWRDYKNMYPDQRIESLIWNDRSTDNMYVMHDAKVFCSVDSGD